VQTEAAFRDGVGLTALEEESEIVRFFGHEVTVARKTWAWLRNQDVMRRLDRLNTEGTVSFYLPRLRIAVDYIQPHGTVPESKIEAARAAREKMLADKKAKCESHGVAYIGLLDEEKLTDEMVEAARTRGAAYKMHGPDPEFIDVEKERAAARAAVRAVDRTKDQVG